MSFPQRVTEITNKTCKEEHLNDCANSKRKVSNKSTSSAFASVREVRESNQVLTG